MPSHSSGSISPTRKRRKLDLGSPPGCNGEIVFGNQGTYGSLPVRASGRSNVVPDGTHGPALTERPRSYQFYKDTRPRNLLMSEAQIGNSQGAPQSPSPNTLYLQTQAIMVSSSTIPNSQANPSGIEKKDNSAPLPTDFSSKVCVETRYTQNAAKSIDDLDDGDVSMDLESPRSPQYHSPEPEKQVTRADSSISHGSMTVLQASEASSQSQITAKSFDNSGANNSDLVSNEGPEDIDSPPYSPRLDDELPGSPVLDVTVATPATTIEPSVTGATTQSTSITPSSRLQQLTLHQELQTPPLPSLPSPLVIPSAGPAVSPLQTLLTLVPCANCGVLWPIFVSATRPDGRNYWYAHSDISCLPEPS